MIFLAPFADVEPRDGGYVALSPDPWLVIDNPGLIAAQGRFVEITYRASFWDEPVRPVFRFDLTDGSSVARIAAGPVAGAGLWVGRVPLGTRRVRVSPTNRTGPFSFEIERIRRRSWAALLAMGFRATPRSARSAVLTRLIGWKPESDVNLAWAIGSTPVADYPAWRAARVRAVDLGGVDRPRCDWTQVPAFHIVIDAREDRHRLGATLEALRAQVFSRWNAAVIADADLALPDDPRIARIDPEACRRPDTLTGWLASGDQLTPEALACVVEAATRHPAIDVFYGDEEVEDASAAVTPWFKPGWSPLLAAQRPYLGRCVFARGRARWSPEQHEPPPDALPLRRMLLRRHMAPPRFPVAEAITPPARLDATVTIVIPTRDQAALLDRCLASIRRTCDPKVTRVVVIDNGSVEAETKALFARLRGDGSALVIEQPGPFNFSAMCNRGAAAVESDVLLFLNNDTEALTDGWLDRMKAWALNPDIGAVGARLTYPDGRLQHIGVLLGMGESAGHFGAFALPGDAGWAGRHAAVHPVSAVTGACLAVARDKFDAVGGFDAVDLPIELSDIDLCLKLSERGWRTIVDPAVHLIHAESASRGGATFRRLDVYERQREIFQARWQRVIRDDPFFHPGLSLYSWEPRLA